MAQINREEIEDMSKSNLVAILLLVIELIKSNDKEAAIAKLTEIISQIKQ